MSEFVTRIDARVNHGLVQAAARLGRTYQIFRPTSAADVAALDPGNAEGSTLLYVTTDPGLEGKNPPNAAKPVWFGAVDTTLTQPGDYLVGPIGTFFLATAMLPQPPSLVLCNAVLTLGRIDEDQETGPLARAGASDTSTILATAFPASLIPGERRSTPEAKLPGEVQLASANVLLPLSLPAAPQRGDTLTTSDVPAQRWTIQSASKGASYWSIIAQSAGA